MQILMSNESHLGIDSIFEYISRGSIKYASKTLEDIYSLIYELENSPYIGRYVPEIAGKHFRELIYKNYRIIYEISEVSNTVYIHFILHSRRDFTSFYQFYKRNHF